MGDRLGILGAVNLLYILLSFSSQAACLSHSFVCFIFSHGRGDGRKGQGRTDGKTGREGILLACRAGEGQGRKECREAGALGLSTRTLKPSDRRRAERSANRRGLPGAEAGGRGSGAMLLLARDVSRESGASLSRHPEAGIASRPFG